MSDRLSSEQCRSELYAWFREHANGELAEYLMSRLAPAPLSDLVTKDYLDAALARSAVETATGFAAHSAETAAIRSEMVEGFAAQSAETAAIRSEMVEGFAAQSAEAAALRSEMVEGFAAQSAETAALRSEMATKSELEAARKESRDRHRRTMAFGAFLGVEILAVQAGWLKPVMDLLASAL